MFTEEQPQFLEVCCEHDIKSVYKISVNVFGTASLADVPIPQDDTVGDNHQIEIILFWQTAAPELYPLC